MRLTINGVDFELLGDPHFGRSFKNGTPFHRLGDREKMQRRDFKASLDHDADAHVCMGDLFDKPKVPNEIVAQVADDYVLAARQSTRPFFCLTGNHDDSRDTGVVSSFQLFTRMVDNDITVVRGEPRRHLIEGTLGDIVQVIFIPWHPLVTAAEMVEQHAELIRGSDAVFGHWDVDRRLEGTDNYIPAARLKELGVGLASTLR